MKLPPELQTQIVDFLISLPIIRDSDGQQAFVDSAGLDSKLYAQISIGKSPNTFIRNLVTTLIRFGQLDDGRNALEAILEAAKNYVGQDRRVYCDTLIEELRIIQPDFILKNPKRGTSLLSVLVIVGILLLGLNLAVSIPKALELEKIEEYQEAVQEIDDRINKRKDITSFKGAETCKIFYKDGQGNDVAYDQFDEEGRFVYRIFLGGHRNQIAKDTVEERSNGQILKKRVHYKDGQAFMQEYFLKTGVFYQKEYDENRDGVYTEIASMQRSEFPGIFIVGWPCFSYR